MIKKFRDQSDELYLLKRKVYLNLLAVDCCEVNERLQRMASDLASSLVNQLVENNRDFNRK